MKVSASGVAENRVRRRHDDRRDEHIHRRRLRRGGLTRRERAAERPGLFWQITIHLFNLCVFTVVIGYFVLLVDHAVSDARQARRRHANSLVDGIYGPEASGYSSRTGPAPNRWRPAEEGFLADIGGFFVYLRERIDAAVAAQGQRGAGVVVGGQGGINSPPAPAPAPAQSQQDSVVRWSGTLRDLARPISEFGLSLFRFGFGDTEST